MTWNRENILGYLKKFSIDYEFDTPGSIVMGATYDQLQQMLEETESNADAWAEALEEAIDEMAGPASDSILERAVEIFEN